MAERMTPKSAIACLSNIHTNASQPVQGLAGIFEYEKKERRYVSSRYARSRKIAIGPSHALSLPVRAAPPDKFSMAAALASFCISPAIAIGKRLAMHVLLLHAASQGQVDEEEEWIWTQNGGRQKKE